MEYTVDPLPKVRTGNVQSTLNAFLMARSILQKYMTQHRLELTENPEEFVPLQPWLNVLREIHQKVGEGSLRAVGAQIIHTANFPPMLNSVDAVLMKLDEIYRINHQGAVGRYRSRKLPDGSVEVCCETPYPRSFERGLIEGICWNKKLSNGRSYSVNYEDGLPGSSMTCKLVAKAL